MGYQLYNNGASIVIAKDGKKVFIMKSSVSNVAIVNGDTVRLNTGCCMGNVSIPYQNVTSPEIYSPSDLLNQISYWLLAIEFPPGPSE
ncbi:MAG: hypothetical protein JSS70_17115 [Bacteroidetes bacterium]|nr:hypothetical protein [Bacteroidota bacterium]